MLSLKWFKSAIERTIEKVVENKIEQAFDELGKEEGAEAPSSISVDVKPYANIKMVNDNLTIVLNDGSILTKSGATSEDFHKARESKTENSLLNIVGSQEIVDERVKAEAEYKKAKAVQQGAEYLAKFDDFEMIGGSLYIKGINRSLPTIMVEEFLSIIGSYPFSSTLDERELNDLIKQDEEYQALKRFFMWCCLNPRAEVANELYRFLKDNSFRITKQGFFVALRNVVTLHGSPELVHFISNAYNKVKAVWKKKPDDYFVFLENGEYKLVHTEAMYEGGMIDCEHCDGSGTVPCDDYDQDYADDNDDSCDCPECDGEGRYEDIVTVNHGEKIGNLTELYLDLPNRAENRFTDDWTKTFDIRIGRPVSMPMSDCNWSTQDCAAAGLHFTSDQIHYVGCGDTSVLVLINPMKVVGIGTAKGRCYEYLPIMTVPRDEATEILHDLEFDTLELDEAYAVRELDNLAEKAKEGFTAEAKKHDFNLPALSAVEMYTIVKSLDEIKHEISKRIVEID